MKNQSQRNHLASVNPRAIAKNKPIKDWQQFGDDDGGSDTVTVDGVEIPKATYSKMIQGAKNSGRKEALDSLKEQFPQLAQQVDQNLPIKRQLDELNQKIADLSDAVIETKTTDIKAKTQLSAEEQIAAAISNNNKIMEEERAKMKIDSFKDQIRAEATKLGLKNEFKDLMPEALNLRYKIATTETGGIAIYDKTTDAQITGESGFATPLELAGLLKNDSSGMFQPKANAPGIGGGLQGNVHQSKGDKGWDIESYGSAADLFNDGISDGEISLPGDMSKGHDRRI